MKENIKKAKKCIKLIRFAATAAVVAMTVYSLIPKYDKITGINTDSLEKAV